MSRRIRTQEEADHWNAMNITADRTGKRIVFIVSTDENVWAEFCELRPRVAEWARIVPDVSVYR